MARKAQQRIKRPELKITSVRDFSGGWNVIDNELSLSPKFAVIHDNMKRFADGSIGPRYGYRLFADAATGTETSGSASMTFSVTNGSRLLSIAWTGHGLSAGHHVTFTGVAAYNGIPATDLNRTHSIQVVDANNITIAVRTAASATDSDAFTVSYTKDTHVLGGTILNGWYFQNYLIVVDETGEVAKIDEDAVITKIWSHHIARNQVDNPLGWAACDYVLADVFNSKLLIVNGKDKPLEIDTLAVNQAQYLVDPADGSNAAIPLAKLIKTMNRYVIMVEEASPSVLRISAKNTNAVFSGSLDPGDAVDIDITNIIGSVNPKVMGLSILRDKLLVALQDSSAFANLGIYVSDLHEPDFTDIIPRHGALSHRAICSLGNDVFLTDFAGVPSVSISQQSAGLVPERVSQLIEPELQKNISRLSDAVLEKQCFALWDPRARQYFLFMPKYADDDVRTLAVNPLTSYSDLLETKVLMLTVPRHGFEEGDYLTISGVTGTVGGVAAANINGQRLVRAIVNENTVLIDVGANVSFAPEQGGGSAVTVQPNNDEMLAYVYTYNPTLKVRVWARYRSLQFKWGAVSLFGRVFFGIGRKVYLFGSDADPIHADYVDDYDHYNWATNTSYTAETRVRDGSTGQVWRCLEDHTSAASGTFAADRLVNPTYWEEYQGEAISWVHELPWADFDKRMYVKSLRHVTLDTQGSGQFLVEAFVDNIYRDPLSLVRSATNEISFLAGDASSFGEGDNPFGGGRRTKEQLLWEYPLRCKTLKLRFSGQTTEAVRIVAVNLTYHLGTIRR